MPSTIKLIVGLGNPGPDYEQTRHNAGAWFINQLAQHANISLRRESKFKSLIASIKFSNCDCWLLQPLTYMNLSGQSVGAFANFYKIPPEEILVAHDELDFPAGVVRLKQGGGHGGHNGLRDIIAHLQSNAFNRLRIGIGHPGNRDQVHDYVLGVPSKHEQRLINHGLEQAIAQVPLLAAGEFQKVMRVLHGVNSEQ